MRRMRKCRCLSLVISAGLILQQVSLSFAADGAAQSSGDALRKSGMLRTGAEADQAAVTWGRYLDSWSAQDWTFQERIRFERDVSAGMLKQQQQWGAALDGVEPDRECAPMIATESKLRTALVEALQARRTCSEELAAEVQEIKKSIADLRGKNIGDPKLFSRILEFDLHARLLDELAGLSRSLWRSLSTAHAQLVAFADLSDEKAAQLIAVDKPLADLLGREGGVNERWNKSLGLLRASASKPLSSAEVERHADAVKAILKLVDTLTPSLKEKTDANSKAHVQMLGRVKQILEQTSEQLGGLAGKSLDGLSEESFLRTIPSDSLSGKWSEFASKQEQIALELVGTLADKDSALETASRLLDETVAEVNRMAGEIGRNAGSKQKIERVLREAVAESAARLAASATAFKGLEARRRDIIERLGAGGKAPFKNPDLRSASEAAAYARLASVHEIAQATSEQMAAEINAICALTEAVRSAGLDVSNDALRKKADDYNGAIGRLHALSEKDSGLLTKHWELSIAVLDEYGRQLRIFSEKAAKEVSAGKAGTYLAVLKAMSAKLKQSATAVSGFSSPVLQAVKGPKPTLAPPPMTWAGAGSVGGSLTRMVARAAYMESAGIGDLKQLLATGDGQDFASMLRIVDLAMALDYPIRISVESDGIAMVLGTEGAKVVVRGIGNPEEYRVDAWPSRPVSMLDFTLAGTHIGGGSLGSLGRWRGDVGRNLGGAAERFLGDSVDTLIDNIAMDPEKLAEYEVYGAVLVAGLALAAATGGAGAPLLILLAKHVATTVATDFGKAMVETAEKRGWIDERTKRGAQLAIEVVSAFKGVRGVAKGLSNLARCLSSAKTVLSGGVPRWTVGLPKKLRSMAESGIVSWKWARRLQYVDTLRESMNSLDDAKNMCWSLPREIYEFTSSALAEGDGAGVTPQSAGVAPATGNSGGTVGNAGGASGSPSAAGVVAAGDGSGATGSGNPVPAAGSDAPRLPMPGSGQGSAMTPSSAVKVDPFGT